MSKILLITMGGTIDSAAYSEEEGQYPARATMTGENRALKGLRQIFSEAAEPNQVFLNTIALCDKDSNELNDDDHEALYESISVAGNLRYDRIIVTMGTDTMCQTAQRLQSKTPLLSCPVVFTGAIWPLANGPKSDGWQNLQQAAFKPADLGNYIYITMGNVFAPADHVYKDRERKVFVDKRTFSL